MIVCICSCVSDKDILREIANGYNTIEALSDRLNVANECSACLFTLEDMLEQAKLDATPPSILQFVEIRR